MSRQVIAYQGEPGANSHIACADVFPKWEALPCASFEDAFAAIQNGRAELGMIPIENSIAGRLSEIHALGQCRRIIRQLGLTPHIAGDTAGSAREVAEWRDPTRAALAPRLAASIYGLDILAEDVEDAAHNTTRFVILSRDAATMGADGGPMVTTFLFRVRNVPAALYKALGGFATNAVNMTKLESYMVEGEFTATQFLADVDGHPDDAPVRRALDELVFFSREFKILGVYPAHRFRSESAAADRD